MAPASWFSSKPEVVGRSRGHACASLTQDPIALCHGTGKDPHRALIVLQPGTPQRALQGAGRVSFPKWRRELWERWEVFVDPSRLPARPRRHGLLACRDVLNAEHSSEFRHV